MGKTFLGVSTGASESAEQLQRIVKDASNLPEASQAIRDHLVSDVADLMQSVKTGQTAKDRLKNYLNQRGVRETLAQFPGIREEIKLFQKTLNTALEKQNTFAQRVDEARLALQRTEKDVKKSAARFYVNSDPTRAVGSVLASPEPVKNMKELVRLAQRDSTGEALSGLRQSLSNYIEQTVRGTTEVGGTQEIMRSKVTRLFQNKTTREAISQLYTPREMEILESVQKELNVLNRINKQVTANSSTAPIQEQIQRARIVLASFYGIVKGRGIFAISNWIMRMAGRDPATIANRVLTDAMLNPELAAVLMAKNLKSRAAREKVKSYLTTYIINNMMDVVQED